MKNRNKVRAVADLPQNISEMVQKRHDQRRIIADAQDELRQSESEIKSYLVREQMWDYISINWRRLQGDADVINH